MTQNEPSIRQWLDTPAANITAVPGALATPLRAGTTGTSQPRVIDVGSRWELFVDEYLIGQCNGVTLKLHEPVRREVVLVTNQPWEGPTCGYFSVVQDGKRVRLYYRGACDGSDYSENQWTCVAESGDGIHFTRPRFNLVAIGGEDECNVIWAGIESHNFTAFLDTNPAAKSDERYKALGGVNPPAKGAPDDVTRVGLHALASADGVRWRRMQAGPVMTKGAFDSQNVAFWDSVRGCYACYSRSFTDGVRTVQSSTSSDFLHWSDAVPNRYAADAPSEHFYTSATVPCPGAPHLLLAFPKRFMEERKKVAGHEQPGVSDAVFMSSRDGIHWDRPFLEAWVRPGPDMKNWTDRNTMIASGIVETASDEWSLYVTEHYRSPDHRLRRLTIRKQGFASVHAGARGGVFVTKPLRFTGSRLELNYATSAAGSVQVELLDENSAPLPGLVLADMPVLYGDELAAVVTWKSGSDLTALRGRTVRLRIVMRDADLFALRFAE